MNLDESNETLKLSMEDVEHIHHILTAYATGVPVVYEHPVFDEDRGFTGESEWRDFVISPRCAIFLTQLLLCRIKEQPNQGLN